jgi:hypothetical protein
MNILLSPSKVGAPGPRLDSTQGPRNQFLLSGQQAQLLAGGLTWLIFLVAACIMALVRAQKGPLDYGILQRCLEWAQAGCSTHHNYIGQRYAHRFIVFAAAFCVLLSPWLTLAWQRIAGAASPYVRGIIAVTLAVFFAGAACYWHDRSYCLVLGIGLVLVGYTMGWNKLGWAPSRKDYAILLWVLGLLLFIPSLWLPMDFTGMPPEGIVDIQSHYSTVVMQGDRLAAGERIFSDVKIYYGVLFPVVLGAFERYFGPISFGGYIQMVKYFQVAFVILSVLLYRAFARHTKLPLLTAALLILPWYHSNHMGILYPNLSAWRLISLPLAVAAIFLLRGVRPPALLAVFLGIIGGSLTTLNLETGIAANIGFVAYLCFRFLMPLAKQPARAAFTLMSYVIAFAIPWVLLSLLVPLLIGSNFDIGSYLSTIFLLAREISAGYSGLPPEFNPVAITIAVHATYCLIKLGLRTGQELGFHNAFRAAICTMILIWFAYYINRPDVSYLFNELMLYGFLLIDVVRTVVVQIQGHRPSRFEPLIVPTLVLATVAIPQIAFGFEFAMPSYLSGLKQRLYGPQVQPAAKLSGVMLQPSVARELIHKGEYIKKRAEHGSVLYLTSDSVLVPKLSGVLTAAKLTEPFQEITFGYQLAAFTERLTKTGPAYILFDDPQSLTQGWSYRRTCFNEIRDRIRGRYQPLKCESGWEIWTRK